VLWRPKHGWDTPFCADRLPDPIFTKEIIMRHNNILGKPLYVAQNISNPDFIYLPSLAATLLECKTKVAEDLYHSLGEKYDTMEWNFITVIITKISVKE
jgi:hypothetical protein